MEESSGFEDGQYVPIQGNVVIRFDLLFEYPWEDKFEDKESNTFTSTSTKMSSELEKLFLNVPGKQQVVVAEFRLDQ